MALQWDEKDLERFKKPGSAKMLVSAVVCVLGGPALVLIQSGKVVDAFWPWLNVPHRPSVLELAVVFPSMIALFLAGILLGSAVWILLMRFCFPREQVEPYVRDPADKNPRGIPGLYARMFDALWPEGK